MRTDGDFSKCLDGVGVEENPALAADGGKLCNGLDRSYLVVGVHHGGQRCLRADGARKGFRIDNARAIHGKNGNLKSFKLFQILKGMKYGMVLDGGRDDVPPSRDVSTREADNAEVARLGAPAGEYQLTWASAEKPCNAVSRFVHRRTGSASGHVDRRGVSNHPVENWKHRRTGFRQKRGACVVI